MARRWAAAGHDVQLIAARRQPSDDDKGWREEQIAGFTLHSCLVPYSNSMSYRRRIKAFVDFAVAAGRRARSLGGDVVFATSTPLTIALPGVYAAKRLRIPMVFEVRDLWPEVPIAMGALKNPATIYLARRLEKFAYNNSTRVVALSPYMADGVARAGFPRDRIVLAPNSSDLDFFDPTPAAGVSFIDDHRHLAGKQIVTYAGSLGKVNGVGYLAQIAAEFLSDEPNVAFVVAGDGAEYEQIKREATRLGVLNQNFFMLGRVTKTTMPSILSATTVATSLVIDVPELRGNSANKFFEALAVAKPVMINHEGWLADLLREHHAGIVVPTKDPAAAAAELKTLLADRERLDACAKASLALARERFSRDVIAGRVLEAIDAAVKQGVS